MYYVITIICTNIFYLIYGLMLRLKYNSCLYSLRLKFNDNI
jgi:hypothetical protein